MDVIVIEKAKVKIDNPEQQTQLLLKNAVFCLSQGYIIDLDNVLGRSTCFDTIDQMTLVLFILKVTLRSSESLTQ